MSRRRRRARGTVAALAGLAALAWIDPPPEAPPEAGSAGEAPLGVRSAIEPPAAEEAATVRVPEGARLFAAPRVGAPVLAIVDFEVELPALEHRGDWTRVRWGDRLGWIGGGRPDPFAPADPRSPASPDAEPSLPPPWAASAADPERLARVRALLGTSGASRDMGRFELLTDVDDVRLLERLSETVGDLPRAFRERYGLEPSIGRQAIALFSDEAGYRAYEAGEGEIAGLAAVGHAGNGIAALFVGDRSAEAAGRVLVHELTHLLNRGVFRTSPPAWLEEAMANDLAFSRTDRRGRLKLATVAGVSHVGVSSGRPSANRRPRSIYTLYLEGPIASLDLLVRTARDRRMLPLPVLLDLSWGEFVALEDRELRYVQSTFLLRYLLDGGQRPLAEGFHAYLEAVAAGDQGGPEALRERLGIPWQRLERQFAAWIRTPMAAR